MDAGRPAAFRAILAAAHAAGPVYQSLTLNGEQLNQGHRDLSRRNLMRTEDFRGARVLDLGCAIGADCFWAIEQGAVLALGVDNGLPQLETFRQLIAASPQVPVACLQHDLSIGIPAGMGAFEVVLCCSITHHIGYRPLWEEVEGAHIAYVEGGVGAPYTAETLSVHGWKAERLGDVPMVYWVQEPRRQVFRLERRL